ncbi:M15 family metallopeptidase [Idiomarina aminovorans]|uniref:M15 family metallopeptidase n=1 Tax=Idiomarina aminovorans TaxID=2914829 RepID=UPI002002ACCF|nr:M15 family metallopeptidase [Idiomarina sp. ATCH4]MCK7458485.1 M15 family metallopeptidase [Idiomarina sp. ATCH4]
MSYRLSNRSLSNLKQCHPQLCIVVTRAIQISRVDFIVGAGIRSIEEQRENVRKGVSKTMNSKHLPQEDGLSHAVDLWPWVNGDIPWDEFSVFRCVADAMLQAAQELDVELRWGGDWDRDGDSSDHDFLDGPHFELVSV